MSGWQLGPGAQNGKSNGLSILIDTEQEQTKKKFKKISFMYMFRKY